MNDLEPTDPRTIGEYRILGRLGSGSQGMVYLAVAPSGDQVAIKRLHHAVQNEAGENERARQQFAKEVAIAGRVTSSHTARLIDANLQGPAPYMVSEYIAGPSLYRRISQDGPITGPSLHRLAVGTATALAAIHQAGVVHRDIQPANVMLSTEGPRIIDFGIARDLSTAETSMSALMVTPAYMSPEQVSNQPVGPPTDMFAWASVMVYAATAHAPFEADHLMAIGYRIAAGAPTLTGVPTALVPVLRRCLAKDPDRRPSAQQALVTLLNWPGLQNSQGFRTLQIRPSQVAAPVAPLAVRAV